MRTAGLCTGCDIYATECQLIAAGGDRSKIRSRCPAAASSSRLGCRWLQNAATEGRTRKPAMAGCNRGADHVGRPRTFDACEDWHAEGARSPRRTRVQSWPQTPLLGATKTDPSSSLAGLFQN